MELNRITDIGDGLPQLVGKAFQQIPQGDHLAVMLLVRDQILHPLPYKLFRFQLHFAAGLCSMLFVLPIFILLILLQIPNVFINAPGFFKFVQTQIKVIQGSGYGNTACGACVPHKS